MPNENTATNEPDRNPHVQIEHSDASLKWILRILAAAIVAAFLIHLFVYLFFRRWQMQLTMERKALSPVSAQKSQMPPEPRLEQIDQLENERPSHAAQTASYVDQLQRYGPTEDKGFVQVPIDRAIDRIQGKLPARSLPPHDVMRRSFGLVDHGEPNSGRLFRRGDR